jgi:hypothetical protein
MIMCVGGDRGATGNCGISDTPEQKNLGLLR